MTCDPLTREECCDGTPCGECSSAGRSRMPSPGCPSRADVIEALSWWEDTERGRWGVEYATEVLEHLEAQARIDGIALAAPPLSPAEQATVDRFEAAPDPWEEG